MTIDRALLQMQNFATDIKSALSTAGQVRYLIYGQIMPCETI